MNKNFSRCWPLVLLCFLLVGWGPFGQKKPVLPTCTDVEVIDLVNEITNEELFKQLLPQHLQVDEAMYKELQGTNELKEYQQVDPQMMGIAYGTLPVEWFMKFTTVSPAAVSIQKKILQQITDMKLTVGAIRVTSQQPDIKKVTCAAQITFANGNSIPIEYVAQNTEDGQIWVEVSGL